VHFSLVSLFLALQVFCPQFIYSIKLKVSIWQLLILDGVAGSRRSPEELFN